MPTFYRQSYSPQSFYRTVLPLEPVVPLPLPPTTPVVTPINNNLIIGGVIIIVVVIIIAVLNR